MGVNYNPKIVTDGLVLALDAANPKSYPGTGDNWYDLSGNGGYAVAYGAPTYSNEGYFNFDGSADYFRFSRSDINGGSNIYTNLTADMWYRPSAVLGTGVSSNNTLTVENAWELSVGNLSNGYSGFTYASNPWAWYGSSSNIIEIGKWHLLTFTHSSIDRKLYVNGNIIYTSSNTGDIGLGSASYPYLTIMGRRTGTDAQCEGDVSVINIYGRSLSQEEIVINFNALRGRYGI